MHPYYNGKVVFREQKREGIPTGGGWDEEVEKSEAVQKAVFEIAKEDAEKAKDTQTHRGHSGSDGIYDFVDDAKPRCGRLIHRKIRPVKPALDSDDVLL